MMTLLSYEQLNPEEFSLDRFHWAELAFEDFVRDSFECDRPVPKNEGRGEAPAWGPSFHGRAVASAMAVFDWVMAGEEAEQALLMISLVEAAERVCTHTAAAWRRWEQSVGVTSALREAIAAIAEVQVWLEWAIAQREAGGPDATALQQQYRVLEQYLKGRVAEAERAALVRLGGDRELQEV